MAANAFGAAIKRREDPRLLTGQARYTDDFTLPGMAHLAVVRSPYAHARIKGISTKKAAAMDGVLGVFTGKDMKDAGFGGIPCAWVVPGSDTKTPAYPPIAIDLVRYAGNAVAIVVATDRYLARDAAEAVEVDYAPLPVVTDAEKATAKGQPQLHAEAPGNQCFHWKVSGGDVEAAFRSADVVVKERIINQRLIPNAMEPRAALAQYMSGAGELTLWVTSQNPHIVRFLLSLDTGIPENKIRVIAPEVGGGFGSKIPHYPEDAMVVFASKTLGCPVKWTETRSENYRSTIHGRDHIQDVEMAAKKDGTILGLRAKVWANMGAYLSTASTGIPTILHGLMLSGAYDDQEHPRGRLRGLHQHDAHRRLSGRRTPRGDLHGRAPRGPARAEAQDGSGRDPQEELHPAFHRRPHRSRPASSTTRAITSARSRRRSRCWTIPACAGSRRSARKKGEHVGVGFSTYAEICGLGPSQVAGAVGFGGGLWESAIVRFHPSGKVNVFVGISPHGQGEETTFAQIVSSELGVPVDDVEIFHGDTAQTPMGWGSYGSRSTPVGSGALMGAIGKIKEKARIVTAHLLEAAVEDIDYADGKFYVKGAPSKSKTIQDVALMANVAWNYPKRARAGPRGLGVLRSAQLRLSVRHPHRRRPRRRGDGRDRARALRRRRRLRPGDQPDDRRGPDPRRHRPGHRPGALGGRGLRRERPAPDRAR